MRRNLKRVIVTAAGFVIFTTNFSINTFADEIDSQLKDVSEETLNNIHTRAEKLNSEKLIVIDREIYREILSSDTAIIERKSNLLTVDSENITEEEKEIIESSESFYLFGKFNGNTSKLEDLDNYKGDLYRNNKNKAAVKQSEENIEKDILIVNEDSMTDYFLALQIGKIEDKNVLLVGNELSQHTQEYLEENASDKSISFLEGDKSISEEMKQKIMEITGAEKYELGKTQIIRKLNQRSETSEKPKAQFNPETVSRSILNDRLENKDSETANRLIEASKKATERTKENNNNLLYNKSKIISLENIENEYLEDFDLIKVINQHSDSTEILNDEDVKDNFDEGYSLTITNAKPIDIHVSVEDGKEEFIVPKETTEEIIQAVMNGEYGNTGDRVRQLTEEGYNASEIQNAIEEIVAENEAQLEAERQEEQRRAEVERHAEEARRSAQRAEERREQERRANEQAQQTASQNNTASISSSRSNSQSSSASTSSSSQAQSAPAQSTPAPSSQAQSTPAPSSQVQSTPAQSTPAPSSQASIESFINAALRMEGWTYSQSQRMQNGFADCSSLVVRAMVNSGMTNNANLTTASMPSDSRFYQVSMSERRRGDILWVQGHMEIYMGNGRTFGAFRPGRPAGYASDVSRFSRVYRIRGY